MVSPTKQIFKCFGCGKGGNVLTFMQEIERIDFRDAVKELAKRYHFDLDKYQTDNKKLTFDADEKAKLKRLHSLAQSYFLDALNKNPNAQAYLKEQRQLSEEFIKQFGVGYAPDSFYELIQLLRSKGFSDNDILEASLAKKNANGEIYAFFRNRITFPIFDTMGNVVAFSARVLNPEDKPKYLNSAEHKAFEKSKVLYGLNFAKNHIKEHEKLIVMEGQMDVLGLARLGFPIGVATSGTSLTIDHIKLLKRYTENIYLLFDNDTAGNQATLRALKLFYQQNIFPKLITLPEGIKDADDLANTPTGNSDFQTCLTNAKDGFLIVYRKIKSELDLTSPIDKQKLLNIAFELILSVNNLAIQEHYKQLVAEDLGFAYEILNTQFKRYKSGEGKILLMQQERQQEQQESQKYQIQRDELFIAFFAKETQEKYLTQIPKLQQLQAFVYLLSKAHPEGLLIKTIENQLDSTEVQKIDEMSLWWDGHLEEFNDPEKKYQIILQTLSPFLQRLLQEALKSPNFTVSEKQNLLNMRKNL